MRTSGTTGGITFPSGEGRFDPRFPWRDVSGIADGHHDKMRIAEGLYERRFQQARGGNVFKMGEAPFDGFQIEP